MDINKQSYGEDLSHAFPIVLNWLDSLFHALGSFSYFHKSRSCHPLGNTEYVELGNKTLNYLYLG
jgi:hypothetical protein